MSNAFVIIKMCYVHNQWYDISCATLYFHETTFCGKLQTYHYKLEATRSTVTNFLIQKACCTQRTPLNLVEGFHDRRILKCVTLSRSKSVIFNICGVNSSYWHNISIQWLSESFVIPQYIYIYRQT